ncbi:MAG: hypothetical protein SYC29_00205 [Planctomycetota bacterium]|nr:hypothetical protein [Planctomycetota bacterium]
MSQMPPPPEQPPPDQSWSPGEPPEQPMPPTILGAPGVPAPREAPGATAGLVLGICSIVFSWPILGLILAWIGFVKSREAKAYCELNPGVYSNYGVAQGGYICSIIGLCLGAFTTLCGCGYFAIVAMAIAGSAAAGAG